jgi:hypothetical protein
MSLRSVLLVPLAGAVLALGGCAQADERIPDQDPTNIVSVQAVSGTNLNEVTLSAEAIARDDLQVRPLAVTTTIPPTGKPIQVMSVPFTAVIYDSSGGSYVYIAKGPRTFVRTPITVQSIDGDNAILSSGPDEGAPIVTVGAPELLGAEYGVGEE